MSLLGYSQKIVVHSSAEMFSKLEAFGFPSSTETQSFALEIFAKVPLKASSGLNVISLLAPALLPASQALFVTSRRPPLRAMRSTPACASITDRLKSSFRTRAYACSTVGSGCSWRTSALTLSSRSSNPSKKLDQKQEREAAVLARKQKTYQLLYSDDDNDGAGGIVNKSLIATASDRHKKRFRKKIESEEDEEDEVVKQVEEARRVKRRTSSYEDDDSEAEQERLRDQGEREQLERNIRERDAAGTCKLTEPKLKKKEEEEAVRRSNALEKNELDTLRKVSRQEYLKKREQKKLEEIRDDIEDEQYLFDGVKLTEAEYHELRRKFMSL
uniref:Uncharacterized protein n=1 Tax=Salix viminalis TaxID=40686 RepID=A0A6N2KDH5_SALVM